MLCLFYDSKCINLSTFYNACTLKLTREVCHIFVCTCIAIFFQNIQYKLKNTIRATGSLLVSIYT